MLELVGFRLRSGCLESENLREMDDEYAKLIRRMNPPRFFTSLPAHAKKLASVFSFCYVL